MAEKSNKVAAIGTEVFRYSRGDEVRVYDLRMVPGGTELWRVTTQAGQLARSVKESDFKESEAAAAYFLEIERTLTAGGWHQLSAFTLRPGS